METITEAVVQFTTSGLDTVKSAISGLKSMLGNFALSWKELGVAIGMGANIAIAIKKYADCEAIMQDLKGALKVSGQAIKENIDGFKQLATAISSVTPVAKSSVYELIQIGMARGLNARQAEEYAASAIGFAKRERISNEEAMEGMIKMASGMRNALDRLDPEIKNATTSQEKLAIANRKAKEGFAMLKEDTDTIKGAMAQLQHVIGSIYTAIGEMFAPMVKAQIANLKEWAEWIKRLIDTAKEFGLRLGDSFSGVGNIMDTLGKLWEKVVAFIRERIKDIVFYVLNWQQTMKMLGVYGAQAMQIIQDRVKWLWENFKIFLSWLERIGNKYLQTSHTIS